MKVDKYKAVIHIDMEEWGEYEVYAPNRDTAAFFAGIRYAKEEAPISPGRHVVIDVIPLMI